MVERRPQLLFQVRTRNLYCMQGEVRVAMPDMPTDFDKGEMHRVLVDGIVVWARFQKIADIS